MTAADFDREIRKLKSEFATRAEPPEGLEQMLLARLREGLETYDSTALEVVYAWRVFESNAAEPPQSSARTLALIDALLPLADHKAMLRSVLYVIRAEITYHQRRFELAAEAFANAVDDLHALHVDVDTKRIYAMVMLGDTLLFQNNKSDAEKLFLDVLSYPWFLVREAEPKRLLREYYVRAGLRLIECRRGDLAGLKDIFFVPATERELLPTLNRAIEEAQRGTAQ
jgi:hypothetical protein